MLPFPSKAGPTNVAATFPLNAESSVSDWTVPLIRIESADAVTVPTRAELTHPSVGGGQRNCEPPPSLIASGGATDKLLLVTLTFAVPSSCTRRLLPSRFCSLTGTGLA